MTALAALTVARDRTGAAMPGPTVDAMVYAVGRVVDAQAPGITRPASAIDALVCAVDDRTARELAPGAGATRERWRLLGSIGRRDLSCARLVEGHLDAAAILLEAAVSDLDPWSVGARWGVWAAHPPSSSLTAHRRGSTWTLDGRKPWCSGASSLTHALVSADTEQGRRLFAAALAHPGVQRDDTWRAVGMRDSDSGDVLFAGVPAVEVGTPGWYVERAGFAAGGMGVAACWLGGARGVADALWRSAHSGRRDPHALAHLGAVTRDLSAAQAWLDVLAEQIDGAVDGLEDQAAALRAFAADVAERTVLAVGHALGAAPLGLDADHAQRVSDLEVYIRQHHAERDLAALGASAADQEEPPWQD